jgi:hypothetical protein
VGEAPAHEFDPKDNSDNSSVEVPVVEGDGEHDSTLGQEDEGEGEDPEEYGERLVDAENEREGRNERVS